MTRPRIEVSDLVVRYGDATAVDGIGFDRAPGVLVTLVGPAGWALGNALLAAPISPDVRSELSRWCFSPTRSGRP